MEEDYKTFLVDTGSGPSYEVFRNRDEIEEKYGKEVASTAVEQPAEETKDA